MDKEFSNVLWDIKEEDRISLEESFLIKRALVYGGFNLIKNVIKNYGFEKTKNIFLSLKESEVGEKRFNFFKNYLFI